MAASLVKNLKLLKNESLEVGWRGHCEGCNRYLSPTEFQWSALIKQSTEYYWRGHWNVIKLIRLFIISLIRLFIRWSDLQSSDQAVHVMPVQKVTGCLPPSSDSLQPFPEYSKMLEKSQNGDDVKRGQYQLFFFYFRPMGSIAPLCQNWLFWFWQKILSECWSKSENCHSTKTFGILDVTVIDFPYL